MLDQLLRVEVGDEEADVVVLEGLAAVDVVRPTNLDSLASENEEAVRAHGKEANKLLAQQLLNIVALLDGDADSEGIDGALNHHALVGISADDQWLQEQLFASPVGR